jgi:hypothetical protein
MDAGKRHSHLGVLTMTNTNQQTFLVGGANFPADRALSYAYEVERAARISLVMLNSIFAAGMLDSSPACIEDRVNHENGVQMIEGATVLITGALKDDIGQTALALLKTMEAPEIANSLYVHADAPIIDALHRWADATRMFVSADADWSDEECDKVLAEANAIIVEMAKLPVWTAEGMAIKAYIALIAEFGCTHNAFKIDYDRSNWTDRTIFHAVAEDALRLSPALAEIVASGSVLA